MLQKFKDYIYSWAIQHRVTSPTHIHSLMDKHYTQICTNYQEQSYKVDGGGRGHTFGMTTMIAEHRKFEEKNVFGVMYINITCVIKIDHFLFNYQKQNLCYEMKRLSPDQIV